MEENKKRVPELRFPEFTDEWEERKLIEVCDYVDYRGKTPKKTDFGIFLVTAKNVKDGYIDYETSKEYISENDYEEVMQRGKPEIGDVLITTEAPCGNVAQVNKSNIALAQRIIKYRGHQNVIYNTYLKHYLLSSKFQAILNAKRSGGTVQGIKGSILHQQEIKYPKYDEQIKIGQYLDTLDNLITLHQHKLGHWKEVKKGLLQKMFPKKGSKVPEIRFPEFTDEWEERKTADIADYSKGNGYSKSDLTEIGTPIILYGRLYTKYQFAINEVDTFATPKGGSVYSQGNEVIIPASGETAEDIARASAVEKSGVLLGGDLNILRPFNFINPLFLALAISSGEPQKELAKKAQGKSVVHIHNSDIQEVSISFPTRVEQDRIVSVFHNLDHFITLYQRKLDHLKELKKGLFQKMFV